MMAPAERRKVLEVMGLKKYFPIQRGFLRKTVGNVKAVDDLSFHISEGETLGLVGESGCGKTTAGRCVLRAVEPTSGSILVRLEQEREAVDLRGLSGAELRRARGKMQMVFQDPYSSLDPRMTIMDIIAEPLRAQNSLDRSQIESRVCDLVRRVGLELSCLKRYPHAFSGGQRQRIGIARALAPNPRLIVADEPVSALDVSVQAQILNLLQDLQAELNLTYLFVAHDLSVVEHISDRVAVMYVGKFVELAETEELFLRPKHPYTEALLSAVPRPDPDAPARRILLED